jgi:hypothetical protein
LRPAIRRDVFRLASDGAQVVRVDVIFHDHFLPQLPTAPPKPPEVADASRPVDFWGFVSLSVDPLGDLCVLFVIHGSLDHDWWTREDLSAVPELKVDTVDSLKDLVVPHHTVEQAPHPALVVKQDDLFASFDPLGQEITPGTRARLRLKVEDFSGMQVQYVDAPSGGLLRLVG